MLKNSVTSGEIDTVIKYLPAKSLGLDRFTAEFYKIFKYGMSPIYFKHFKEIEKYGVILNSFKESNNTLISKLDKLN